LIAIPETDRAGNEFFVFLVKDYCDFPHIPSVPERLRASPAHR
jgi:hypothetical protein